MWFLPQLVRKVAVIKTTAADGPVPISRCVGGPPRWAAVALPEREILMGRQNIIMLLLFILLLMCTHLRDNLIVFFIFLFLLMLL